MLKPLTYAAVFVDSFSHMPLDTVSFIHAMQQRRTELNDFYLDLVKIDRSDRFFWQRVYALCGVSFETRRSTFIENIKLRLGIGVAESPDLPQPARAPLERIALD
jgi:hypothetical protein